jgi:hypothetical protein
MLNKQKCHFVFYKNGEQKGRKGLALGGWYQWEGGGMWGRV